MKGYITDWNARSAAMEKVAFNLDMNFVHKDDWGLLNRLKGFKLFKWGHSRKIFNLMAKADAFMDEQYRIFDYQYVISSNNSSRRYIQTVFFIQSKFLGLPEFLLKPENFFHKIGSFLGMQDIDFEEHPEFSKKYLLQGEDEARIRDVMNNQLIWHFTVEKDWHLEGVGYYLVLYRLDHLVPPKTVEQFYKKGMQIYSFLKE